MALAVAVCRGILQLFLGQPGHHDPGHGAGGRDQVPRPSCRPESHGSGADSRRELSPA